MKSLRFELMLRSSKKQRNLAKQRCSVLSQKFDDQLHLMPSCQNKTIKICVLFFAQYLVATRLLRLNDIRQKNRLILFTTTQSLQQIFPVCNPRADTIFESLHLGTYLTSFSQFIFDIVTQLLRRQLGILLQSDQIWYFLQINLVYKIERSFNADIQFMDEIFSYFFKVFAHFLRKKQQRRTIIPHQIIENSQLYQICIRIRMQISALFESTNSICTALTMCSQTKESYRLMMERTWRHFELKLEQLLRIWYFLYLRYVS